MSPPQSTHIPICILSMYFVGLRKNGTSWDVVRLDFVVMSNISVPPHCAIPSIKPQTCIFNALTNMVEGLKDLIKNQSNLRSYKTVPFPAVWERFITELSLKGRVAPGPSYGQLVYYISASKIHVSRQLVLGIVKHVSRPCGLLCTASCLTLTEPQPTTCWSA